MTVVLGLRCADGLILATDSQGTASMPGGYPVRIRTPKIHQVGESLLFAGTGSQGIGQRVEAALRNNLTKLNKKQPRAKLGVEIFRIVNPLQKEAEASYVQVPQASMPVWGGIFCGQSSEGPYLLEIDLNGTWQFHDTQPFTATGSGHAFAHLAISSVLHYEVEKQPLQIAQMLAYRAIENVCLASAFGVNVPVQMGVLADDEITILDDGQLKALEDSVNLWKRKEVETLGGLAPRRETEDLVPSENGDLGASETEGLEPPA